MHFEKSNATSILIVSPSKELGSSGINLSRGFAIYACRRYGNTGQKQLGSAFGLNHAGSAAYSINKVKKEIAEGRWEKQIKWLEKHLDIVKCT